MNENRINGIVEELSRMGWLKLRHIANVGCGWTDLFMSKKETAEVILCMIKMGYKSFGYNESKSMHSLLQYINKQGKDSIYKELLEKVADCNFFTKSNI